MNSDSFLRPSLITACLAALTAGCGSETVTHTRAAVQGTVTLNGEMLRSGRVRFVPIDGTPGPKTTLDIIDGHFLADAELGPVVGRHRVEVLSDDSHLPAPDDEGAMERLRESGPPDTTPQVIPPRFSTNSQLSVSVSETEFNRFDFELQSRSR